MKIVQLVLACAVAIGTPAHAQKACSKADAAAAEKALERVVSWQALRKTYADYKHCDTEKVEDQFTDALMRLLVGWKNIDAVAADYGKDADYKAWITKHLMSEAAKDDREDVYSLAKKNCPKGQEAFCSGLADTVRPAKGEPLKPFNLDPLPKIKPQ
jgi:hypothetical protein